MKDVRVIKINIGDSTAQQTVLREEAARLWVRLVNLHKYCRKRRWSWPTQGELEKHFKGRFALHSQTIQALIGKFIANIDSTRSKRKSGDKTARYPWRNNKKYQVVMWKSSAIRLHGNRLVLSNGSGRKKLTINLGHYQPAGKIVAAELGFRELRLTISREVDLPVSAGQNVVAADLGVIHLAALTDGVVSMAVVGRGLRSLVQGKNKQLAAYQYLLSKTKKGSRANRKLRVAKAKMLFKFNNRVHNLLHHATNEIIDFCVSREAGLLVVGDVADIARNSRKNKKGSRRTNQMNSGNPLGKVFDYLIYKGRLKGVLLKKEPEHYTTQTCPVCCTRYKPTGRVYKCRHCGFVGVRDNVGTANILNKHLHGKIVAGAIIPPEGIKYHRPVKLTLRNGVARLTGGTLLDNTLSLASAPAIGVGGNTPLRREIVA